MAMKLSPFHLCDQNCAACCDVSTQGASMVRAIRCRNLRTPALYVWSGKGTAYTAAVAVERLGSFFRTMNSIGTRVRVDVRLPRGEDRHIYGAHHETCVYNREPFEPLLHFHRQR